MSGQRAHALPPRQWERGSDPALRSPPILSSPFTMSFSLDSHNALNRNLSAQLPCQPLPVPPHQWLPHGVSREGVVVRNSQ